MSGTTYHASVSVDIDRFSDARLEHEWLPVFRSAGCTTVEDIRRLCQKARERGQDAFATCDRTARTGLCLGHHEPPPPEPWHVLAACEAGALDEMGLDPTELVIVLRPPSAEAYEALDVEAPVQVLPDEKDALAALAAIVHERDDLSEGQFVAITGLDRLRVRELQDYGAKLLDGRPEVRPEWRWSRHRRASAKASRIVDQRDAARAEADRLRERVTALEADAARVCGTPGCTAAVVRQEDGRRVCSAGHPSRWVEVSEVEALQAELDRHRAELGSLRRGALARRCDLASCEYDLARLISTIRDRNALKQDLRDLADQIDARGRSGWMERALSPEVSEPVRQERAVHAETEQGLDGMAKALSAEQARVAELEATIREILNRAVEVAHKAIGGTRG